MVLTSCLVICTTIELLSMWNLTRIEVQLCNILSPEAPQLSLASYNWCLVSLISIFLSFLDPYEFMRMLFLSIKLVALLLTFFNWMLTEQVFIAMLVDNFLYPISAFRSHFSQSINWSGIRYHLRNGKISKVYMCACVFFFSSCFNVEPLNFMFLFSTDWKMQGTKIYWFGWEAFIWEKRKSTHCFSYLFTFQKSGSMATAQKVWHLRRKVSLVFSN